MSPQLTRKTLVLIKIKKLENSVSNGLNGKYPDFYYCGISNQIFYYLICYFTVIHLFYLFIVLL